VDFQGALAKHVGVLGNTVFIAIPRISLRGSPRALGDSLPQQRRLREAARHPDSLTCFARFVVRQAIVDRDAQPLIRATGTPALVPATSWTLGFVHVFSVRTLLQKKSFPPALMRSRYVRFAIAIRLHFCRENDSMSLMLPTSAGQGLEDRTWMAIR
jgi:hypothetical protein